MHNFVLFLLATGASAQGTVSFKWSDCGAAGTLSKITDLSPTTATIGQKTTITATFTLSKDVPDATFESKLKIMGATLMDCKGDASVAKTCNYPFGAGSMTFDALAFPLKAGSGKSTTEVLINTMSGSSTTVTTLTTSSGDQVSCVQIITSKAEDSLAFHPGNMHPALLATGAYPQGTLVNFKWSDCGDASTHSKITGFSPTTATIGQKTTITATFDLDKDISDASFESKLKIMGATLMDCKGDASTATTCKYPFGAGSMTFDPISFPLKAGKGLTSTTEVLINTMTGSSTTVTSLTSSSGDKVSCVQIITSKADVAAEGNVCPGGSYKACMAQCPPDRSHADMSLCCDDLGFDCKCRFCCPGGSKAACMAKCPKDKGYWGSDCCPGYGPCLCGWCDSLAGNATLVV